MNYEQVEECTVFSKVSGMQFGHFDIFFLEDLTIFDAQLPRTAVENPEYDDYELNIWNLFETAGTQRAITSACWESTEHLCRSTSGPHLGVLKRKMLERTRRSSHRK